MYDSLFQGWPRWRTRFALLLQCMHESFWGLGFSEQREPAANNLALTASGRYGLCTVRTGRCIGAALLIRATNYIGVCTATGCRRLRWLHKAHLLLWSQVPRAHHVAAAGPTLFLLLQYWWTWACHLFCWLFLRSRSGIISVKQRLF